MNPNQIEEHLRRRPFIPIRLHMSDGSSYEVRHPEVAIVSIREVVVGVDHLAESVPERFVYLDPVHVTRIVPIEEKPKSNGKRKR